MQKEPEGHRREVLAVRDERDRLQRALEHYREGAFPRALALLDEAIARAPDNALAHYLRGIVCKDAGRDREAVAAFDRVFELAPDLERLHYHRGTARYLAGDRAGALEDLERAVAKEPEFLFAVYNLGVAAVSVCDWPRAKQAFERALELDPTNRGEYVDLLVEIGRASAQQELYTQAHRLKNMIGVVGDDARALVARLEEVALRSHGERVAEGLGRLYEDMTRLLRSVDPEPPRLEVIEVEELIDRVWFALSPRLGGVRCERRIHSPLPEVIGDPRSLAEALMNVLVNAVEACQTNEEQPGAIELEVDAVDAIPEIPGVDTIRICVRDNGPGIASDHLERIFEMGFTTKRFGTGLGLSSAARTIEAHGGRIEVCNRAEAGRSGAEVTVYLAASPVGAPSLRNLSLRSVLFEDLRPLVVRGGLSDVC